MFWAMAQICQKISSFVSSSVKHLIIAVPPVHQRGQILLCIFSTMSNVQHQGCWNNIFNSCSGIQWQSPLLASTSKEAVNKPLEGERGVRLHTCILLIEYLWIVVGLQEKGNGGVSAFLRLHLHHHFVGRRGDTRCQRVYNGINGPRECHAEMANQRHGNGK